MSKIYQPEGEDDYKKQHVGQSRSLWNFALSPGWDPKEAEILKMALMKHGVGRWVTIAK